MIREIQSFWNNLEKQRIKTVAEKFKVASSTAKKYIEMTQAEINAMDSPKNYKKRESTMNKWLNVIFKMMDDGHKNETIYFYIRRQADFQDNTKKLADYIYTIGKNNFPNKPAFNPKQVMEPVLPEGVILIKRSEVLKYILTVNPKTKKDEKVGRYIDLIKEKHPIANRIELIFKDFHSTIMGSKVENLDYFLSKYEDSEIRSFCNGIKRDIVPVRNAISSPVSSGFVEGNNNKFKLIKRIVYGRSKLENLTKKCKLAFLPKDKEFELANLL